MQTATSERYSMLTFCAERLGVPYSWALEQVRREEIDPDDEDLACFLLPKACAWIFSGFEWRIRYPICDHRVSGEVVIGSTNLEIFVYRVSSHEGCCYGWRAELNRGHDHGEEFWFKAKGETPVSALAALRTQLVQLARIFLATRLQGGNGVCQS